MKKLKDLFLRLGHHPPTHLCNEPGTRTHDRTVRIVSDSKRVVMSLAYQQNIFAKQRTAFQMQEGYDHFIQDWNMLLKSSTKPEFQARLEKMRGYLPVPMDYLASTWLKYKVTACHFFV